LLVDLTWTCAFAYEIPDGTFYNLIREMLYSLNEVLPPIMFPVKDPDKLEQLAEGFAKYSLHCFPGTVAAGDGIVFEMDRPTVDEAKGDVISYYCRKGFHAHAMVAFCDSNVKFLNVTMLCTGSVHDATHYSLSKFKEVISTMDKKYHVVMDEAFGCTNSELTPWRGQGLSEEKKSFNFYLSRQRQCIERAFGVLVARWGILWRPLKIKLKYVPTLVHVLCKLHNVCIDTKVPIQITSADVMPDDYPYPAYTTYTVVKQGFRSDIENEQCSKREIITMEMKRLKIFRPQLLNYN